MIQIRNKTLSSIWKDSELKYNWTYGPENVATIVSQICLHALRNTMFRVWMIRAHCLDATHGRFEIGLIPPSVPESVAIAKSRMPRIGSLSSCSAVGYCPIGLPRFLATYSSRIASACPLCACPTVFATFRTVSIG